MYVFRLLICDCPPQSACKIYQKQKKKKRFLLTFKRHSSSLPPLDINIFLNACLHLFLTN